VGKKLSKVKRKLKIKYFLIALAALTVCLLAALIDGRPNRSLDVSKTLTVNGHKFSLEVAKTPAQRTRGLGNRVSLPQDHGMIFVFSKPAVECFWMKDTHFPLDMIWIDSNKNVIQLIQNVSPSTYPETFCPDQPAKYVIELNAGTARSVGIHEDQTLSF
jgi:uncharacterized membrane protein (UPF0127 family)